MRQAKTREMMIKLLLCTCLTTGLACCQSTNGKIVDVRPYTNAGPSVVAPNNGYPVVIPTSRNMFSLSVSLDDMIYSVEVRESRHVKPGDFIVGDPIEAHLEKDRLVITEPSGKQIKEKVVRRERVTNPK